MEGSDFVKKVTEYYSVETDELARRFLGDTEQYPNKTLCDYNKTLSEYILSINTLYDSLMDETLISKEMRKYISIDHRLDFIKGIHRSIEMCEKKQLTQACLEDDVGWDDFLAIIDENVKFTFIESEQLKQVEEIYWNFIKDHMPTNSDE
jgi:hypothetical protein